MRGPINWIVMCLSLLFLLANLSAGRRLHVAEIAVPMAPIDVTAPVTEFGYVRADGSFLPLAREPFEETSFDTGAAVFVWSTPWPAPAGEVKGEGASLTSTLPSWQ